MRSVESDWWIIDLPEEWEAEQDEETIVITDPDGLGMLEITALQRDEAEVSRDLTTAAGELLPEDAALQRCTLAGLDAVTCSYIDEEDAVRDWLAVNDELVLLVTYSCAIDDRGMDDAMIDEILETLELKLAAAPE
jgi:hypothetical protein